MIKHKRIKYSEYYDMLGIFDELYDKSKRGEIFTHLMRIITSHNNILLAYRCIKSNKGSHSCGTDNKDIDDIKSKSPTELVSLIRAELRNCKPCSVKRCEIPKANGKTRPLGIPTIIDRIIQQCILQILEPICEAKFHECSYGFRPGRSQENALAQCYDAIQNNKLLYVVDVDIKAFFDNVNHSKLVRQMWHIGIRDKRLISIIKEILKAPVLLPNGEIVYPSKGTPQGGILSPLLANIVLNELDWMLNEHLTDPQYDNYHKTISGTNAYKKFCDKIPEGVQYTRYADDFKVFCRTQMDADMTLNTISKWLKRVLKLDISPEKSHIVNLEDSYSEFLGFKFKAVKSGDGFDVKSYISDKALGAEAEKLHTQIKIIQNNNGNDRDEQIKLCISKISGIHNYYKYATEIKQSCMMLQAQIDNFAVKESNVPNVTIRSLENISYQPPKLHNPEASPYTTVGRMNFFKRLKFGDNILEGLHALSNNVTNNGCIEYFDNTISVYARQHGICYVTKEFLKFDDVCSHHIVPLENGGDDKCNNLVIISRDIYKLIHAVSQEEISSALHKVVLTKSVLKRINKLRRFLGLPLVRLY